MMNVNSQMLLSIQKVVVMGLGYIGLPTAAILASRKIEVVGVDISQKTVDVVNRGEIHIVEPELDIVVQAAVAQGFLRASLKPEEADVFIIAVPTPFKENHEPDLSYIQSAACAISPYLKSNDLVILESTSPVGTTEQLAAWLATSRPDLTFPQKAGEQADIRMAYCPERVLPGHILRELVQNDRIIGGMTSCCSLRAMSLYQTFVAGECMMTDARTAEMCKLTENSFRDVNIAFANELSMICDELDIDVSALIRLANRHPRVNILKPGPGVGGHCIAVDPWFIVHKTPNLARLIETARCVNDSKPTWVVGKVNQAVAEFLLANPHKTVKDVTIACFGLAFKPDIDDLRESPALKITQTLALTHPGHVIVVEPHIQNLPDSLKERAELKPAEEALAEADVAVMLVQHKLFDGVIEACGYQGRLIQISE